MLRLASFALALFTVLTPAVRADHFTIDLRAHAGKDTSAAAIYPTPASKPAVRAILTVVRNTPITVKWTLRNTDPAATVKDVLVHFFVVRQEKLDQPEVPKLNKHVAVESALTMDFRPQDRTEGEITFAVPQAGYYLIRVELKGAAGKSERAPFAALDLVVR
jgi:hypothetical protein